MYDKWRVGKTALINPKQHISIDLDGNIEIHDSRYWDNLLLASYQNEFFTTRKWYKIYNDNLYSYIFMIELFQYEIERMPTYKKIALIHKKCKHGIADYIWDKYGLDDWGYRTYKEMTELYHLTISEVHNLQKAANTCIKQLINYSNYSHHVYYPVREKVIKLYKDHPKLNNIKIPDYHDLFLFSVDQMVIDYITKNNIKSRREFEEYYSGHKRSKYSNLFLNQGRYKLKSLFEYLDSDAIPFRLYPSC